jgi:methylglutaconyl-CoA hydratase
MDALIDSKVQQILLSSPAAIAAAKALIFGVAARTFDNVMDFTAEAIANARASEEGQAGMKAFLSRQKPPWTPQ